MKKNVLISGYFNPFGFALAKILRANSAYVYGLSKKEDYEGVCDRAFRFDINQFASEADYRIRFTQIFDEIVPRLDALVICNDTDLKGRLHDVQLENWQNSMNENVTGPMLLCKLFHTRLERSNGTVFFVGPDLSRLKKSQSISHKTTKAALDGLYESISKDLAGKVKVNRIITDPLTSSSVSATSADEAKWDTLTEVTLNLINSTYSKGGTLLDIG